MGKPEVHCRLEATSAHATNLTVVLNETEHAQSARSISARTVGVVIDFGFNPFFPCPAGVQLKHFGCELTVYFSLAKLGTLQNYSLQPC